MQSTTMALENFLWSIQSCVVVWCGHLKEGLFLLEQVLHSLQLSGDWLSSLPLPLPLPTQLGQLPLPGQQLLP